ncbi:MAG: hypothetical protein IIB06_10045 [Bacteroidetes bacterium]|nr:hypothetical protein [Bacteroidota bacterium]
MNFSIKLSILFFLSVIIYSCSSDDNSTNSIVEPTNDFAELNGTWTGETRILQAGDCISINKNWTPVELDILVDETGKVLVIEERQYSNQDMIWYVLRTQWEGQVLINDSLFLTKTTIIDCFGTDNTEITDFKSKLIKTVNLIEFRINDIEVFCPIQNCIFERDYILSIDR